MVRGPPSADELAAVCAVLGPLLTQTSRPSRRAGTPRVHTWTPPWHCPPHSWRHHPTAGPGSPCAATPADTGSGLAPALGSPGAGAGRGDARATGRTPPVPAPDPRDTGPVSEEDVEAKGALPALRRG
ncbi:hypothetical protein [Streptacidiphilus melanogenes]|uniref:hypothetical protein n=1 Tax=Streptacidiphilus melanogenes TaxID=411235 RepID=UPI0034E21940